MPRRPGHLVLRLFLLGILGAVGVAIFPSVAWAACNGVAIQQLQNASNGSVPCPGFGGGGTGNQPPQTTAAQSQPATHSGRSPAGPIVGLAVVATVVVGIAAAASGGGPTPALARGEPTPGAPDPPPATQTDAGPAADTDPSPPSLMPAAWEDYLRGRSVFDEGTPAAPPVQIPSTQAAANPTGDVGWLPPPPPPPPPPPRPAPPPPLGYRFDPGLGVPRWLAGEVRGETWLPNQKPVYVPGLLDTYGPHLQNLPFIGSVFSWPDNLLKVTTGYSIYRDGAGDLLTVSRTARVSAGVEVAVDAALLVLPGFEKGVDAVLKSSVAKPLRWVAAKGIDEAFGMALGNMIESKIEAISASLH